MPSDGMRRRFKPRLITSAPTVSNMFMALRPDMFRTIPPWVVAASIRVPMIRIRVTATPTTNSGPKSRRMGSVHTKRKASNGSDSRTSHSELATYSRLSVSS